VSQEQPVGAAVQRRWQEWFDAARATMRSRSSIPRSLVEVAAQHPLVDGQTPGPEFTARLTRGAEVYWARRNAGEDVEIYVPGSRHRVNDVQDQVSLSTAGVRFLRELGVQHQYLHGDDLNDKYKGRQGVYGSADECFVATRFYFDGNFGRLFSVCSPSQMIRKTLHYIAFGVVPLNVTAPVDEPYHDYLHELFQAVPHVLAVDSTLQEDDSAEARRLRRDRRPKA
jgi:hypothetical protein